MEGGEGVERVWVEEGGRRGRRGVVVELAKNSYKKMMGRSLDSIGFLPAQSPVCVCMCVCCVWGSYRHCLYICEETRVSFRCCKGGGREEGVWVEEKVRGWRRR